jgi:serpin B
MSKLLCFTVFSLASIISLNAGPSENLVEMTKSHREFALSLYPLLNAENENLVFSPYSLATCLSMVYLGARGETASQMAKTLHLEIDRKSIAKTSSELTQSFMLKKKEENAYQLNVANALWLDQGTFLLADFRYAIEEQFKAKLSLLNFAQPSNALASINNWVSQQTQEKIPQLLTEKDINPLTRLILTNALYFQGTWAQPFDQKITQNANFHPTPDTTSTVKMMAQTLSTPYYENELIQAVALPFIGMANSSGRLAFVILLPKSADNFSSMYQELSDSFESWISSMKYQRVELKIPKFNLANRYDLNEPLEALGMQDAFDSDANFIGIDGMRDLFLNKVIHQTFFDLDENGITAAASTAASMSLKSSLPQEPSISMNVDHPFLFFIVDLKSQEMLFMGKIAEPNLVK